jgi:hypothetical protein
MSCCFDMPPFCCYPGTAHRLSHRSRVTRICRHSGPDRIVCEQNSQSISLVSPVRESTSLSFSAPYRGAGYFLFRQKVAKDHDAYGGGRTNTLSVRLPCDARRTAAAPNSHIPVLRHAALAPPFGCASRHCQWRRNSLRRSAIHGLRNRESWRRRSFGKQMHPARGSTRSEWFGLSLSEARQAVIGAKTAPLHVAEARSRSREQGAHVRLHGRRSSRRRAIGEHRGRVRRQDVGGPAMPGAMALVTFPERKVTRAAGIARNRDRNVCNDRRADTAAP